MASSPKASRPSSSAITSMEMGVQLGQGYLFGKPQPITSIFGAIIG